MMKLKTWVLALTLAQIHTVCAEDLITIYQQAVQADPELRTAALKVEIGTAQKGQALGQLLPQISATGNWSENEQINDSFYSPTSTRTVRDPTQPSGLKTVRGAQIPESSRTYPGTRYYISLNQSLINFAEYWDWRRAVKVEEQYTHEHKEAQNTLMLNVVSRYFGVLEAEDLLYLVRNEKELTQKQQQQIEKQYAKQLVKITDLYEVQARVDQLIADEIEAESKLVTAQEALKELTNTPLLGLYKLRESIEYKELEGKLEDWLAVAKSENPSLSAQVKAIEAASDNVTVQKSRYLPVVDLQLNYYDTNTSFQNQFMNSGIQTQTAAINVTMPIFTGGTDTHRIFEAQSRLAIAKEENEAKMRGLVKETSDAFLTSNANVKRIRATAKALESATKSREAMETGFRYGTETIGDVLHAQQVEFRAKRELSQAKYSYVVNRIRFLRAIGTVSEDNLVEVNNWLQKTAAPAKETVTPPPPETATPAAG